MIVPTDGADCQIRCGFRNGFFEPDQFSGIPQAPREGQRQKKRREVADNRFLLVTSLRA
jgi:hypothetical protein